jgi:hypothetical protein
VSTEILYQLVAPTTTTAAMDRQRRHGGVHLHPRLEEHACPRTHHHPHLGCKGANPTWATRVVWELNYHPCCLSPPTVALYLAPVLGYQALTSTVHSWILLPGKYGPISKCGNSTLLLLEPFIRLRENILDAHGHRARISAPHVGAVQRTGAGVPHDDLFVHI